MNIKTKNYRTHIFRIILSVLFVVCLSVIYRGEILNVNSIEAKAESPYYKDFVLTNKVFFLSHFDLVSLSFSSSSPFWAKRKEVEKEKYWFRFSPPFPLPQKRSRRKEFSFLLLSIPSSLTRRKNEKENLYPISFSLLYLFQKWKKWLYS